MKTQRVLRITIILLLHAPVALCAMSDSSRVYTFIEQWRKMLFEEEVNCHYVELCYADTIQFYNASFPRSGMCFHVVSIPFLNENLLEPGYTLPRLSDVQWRATFESANNIFGLNKSHYIEIEESAGNEFLITKQSSVADDQWFTFKQQFVSQTISQNGKPYFILNEDSTTLPGYRLYILTDSLVFTAPEHWALCSDEKTTGYYTAGNVFIAMSKKNSKAIATMQDLTPQLMSDTYHKLEILQKGILCFGVRGSKTENNPVWTWAPAFPQWSATANGGATIQFTNPYNHGDECVNIVTTVQVQKRKKKITVLQFGGIKPGEPDQY